MLPVVTEVVAIDCPRILRRKVVDDTMLPSGQWTELGLARFVVIQRNPETPRRQHVTLGHLELVQVAVIPPKRALDCDIPRASALMWNDDEVKEWSEA